jgi:hypothetical protein
LGLNFYKDVALDGTWFVFGLRSNSRSNVFIPKFRPGLDEIAHELDARRVLEHFHFHALRNS